MAAEDFFRSTALKKQPDGTLALQTPPDPRTGTTSITLDPFSGPATVRRAIILDMDVYWPLDWPLCIDSKTVYARESNHGEEDP